MIGVVGAGSPAISRLSSRMDSLTCSISAMSTDDNGIGESNVRLSENAILRVG